MPINHVLLALLAITTRQAPDSLDAFIRAELSQRRVPGLSLAIIDQGKVVYAKGYGVTAPGGKTPVTPATLFLAGSISKSVAAAGALRLAEQGRIGLDANVNDYLTTWKVPDNQFTGTEKVTLRRILSHTAGLTVHGFGGYEVGSPIPSLVEILNGTPPANSPPVRVDTTPGSRWRYSGGGYTIMQLMMDDVTGTTFPGWMQEHVLAPAGMTSSTFEQKLPASMAALAAAGQYAPGKPVPGRWHAYPEMAAAGLWTTASDLAQFVITMQRAWAGTATPIISQQMTRLMLTNVMNDDGLGVFLQGAGDTLLFFHGGRDDGFDAYMGGFAQRGQGIVIMINANDNSGMMRRIYEFVARQYQWPGSEPAFAITPEKIPAARLASYSGYYEASNNNILTLAMRGGSLVSLADGLPDRTWVPTGQWQVTSRDRSRQFVFLHQASGEVTGFTRVINGKDVPAPLISPLLANAKPERDTDPAKTARADSAIRALAKGRAAVEASTVFTTGARSDFLAGAPGLETYDGMTYVRQEDVTGRGLERHGSPVALVRAYRLANPANGTFLLVYFTSDGLVTDYDFVSE